MKNPLSFYVNLKPVIPWYLLPQPDILKHYTDYKNLCINLSYKFANT